MNYKIQLAIGILLIIFSLALLTVSYFFQSTLLFIISVLLLLVSIFLLFIGITIDMFRRDKQLDIESLKKQGLTIVKCLNCHRKNVLEDQYCIFCGERLGEHHE